MNWIDFFIGFTLMNAMPHFVLGVWKAKMLSGFGVGNLKNIIWGLLNFAVSIGLFLYEYGIGGLIEKGFYTGALLVMTTFLITSYFWQRYFYRDENMK